jgi:hypothetical protein
MKLNKVIKKIATVATVGALAIGSFRLGYNGTVALNADKAERIEQTYRAVVTENLHDNYNDMTDGERGQLSDAEWCDSMGNGIWGTDDMSALEVSVYCSNRNDKTVE